MKLLILSCILSIALATPVRRSASSSEERRGPPIMIPMPPPLQPQRPMIPQQPPQTPQLIPIPFPYDPAQGNPAAGPFPGVPAAGPFPFPFPSYPGVVRSLLCTKLCLRHLRSGGKLRPYNI
ncbi:WAS/WASL-interacting protein family member 3-like [Elgaria multicarinata webbii]|uniref:WAS/WASL-interacting protein family member 3-like n=1 Tax=Elgaria multicarinata webbii TaxID=159646 RepID=UPI002FCD4B36